MEKILLPEHLGFKANLHSHSTDSDGALTPEEMKAFYQKNGYSILGYTDHLYMRDRSALNDENFVALNGYENSLNETGSKIYGGKCYHLNFYSPKPDQVGMVGITERLYTFFNTVCTHKTPEQLALAPLLDEGEDGFCDPTYSVENANAIIKKAKELGYLVVLNHPVWSGQTESDWKGLQGLTGMEIFNYGGWIGGYEEDAGYIYDEMLRDGQRICCTANDDNHNRKEYPPFPHDSFGGFNIMYPKKLDYTSVFNALKDGDLYASTGGILRGVVVKDGKLFVGAENASYIRLTANGRHAQIKRSLLQPVTEAVFELPEGIKYFRITMKDMQGRKAYTRAYFQDEWKEE